jgi:membrane associated rhomboid family serine protease
MGYRDNTGSSRSNLFNTANPLVMLVVLQITFFILMNFLKSIYVFSRIPEEQFYRNIYHWFVMPADPMQFITRPWTLITMQFTEVKVILVISNLIWLWTFGYLIQDLIGNDKIIPIYIYSATISGIAFLGAANIIYPGATQSIFFSGAVSGILGLAVAATTVSPQYRFFPMIGGGIPLWIIALIYLLLNLSSAFSNPVLLLPVAAGGLTGFVYVRMLQKGFFFCPFFA